MAFSVILQLGHFGPCLENIQSLELGGDFMPMFLAATPTTNMADFLAILTSAFTSILSCVTEAASTIVGHPFLLFTVIFLFAGGVIGILGRILSRN